MSAVTDTDQQREELRISTHGALEHVDDRTLRRGLSSCHPVVVDESLTTGKMLQGEALIQGGVRIGRHGG